MWVQYWGSLPAIVEEPMTDGTAPTTRTSMAGHLTTSSEATQRPAALVTSQGSIRSMRTGEIVSGSAMSTLATQPQQSSGSSRASLPLQQAAASAWSMNLSTSNTQGLGSYGSTPAQMTASFGIGHLSSSLPEYPSQSFGPFAAAQRFPSAMPTPSMMHQFQPFPRFAGQPTLIYPGQHDWIPVQYPTAYTASYPSGSLLAPSGSTTYQYPPRPSPPSIDMTGLRLGTIPFSGQSWPTGPHQPSGYSFDPAFAGYDQPSRESMGSTGRQPLPSSRRASLPSAENPTRPYQGVGISVYPGFGLSNAGVDHGLRTEGAGNFLGQYFR